MGLKTKFGILGVAAIFAWHFFISAGLYDAFAIAGAEKADMSISANWLTNVVTISVQPSLEASGLKTPIIPDWAKLVAQSQVERGLNLYARSNVNLYAILVPYSVRVVEEQPTEAQLAGAEQIRLRREAEKAEREAAEALATAKRKALRQERLDYASRSIEIENGRVSKAQNFGDPVPGIFGTLVNHGHKDLSKVEVTVYFLDRDGMRIGEESYHPIWTDGFLATAPLRSGYREDFGYKVDETAPSRWAERVEFEITDIEFLQSQGDSMAP